MSPPLDGDEDTSSHGAAQTSVALIDGAMQCKHGDIGPAWGLFPVLFAAAGFSVVEIHPREPNV